MPNSDGCEQVAGTQAVFFVMLYAVQRQKGARVAGGGGEGVTVSR